MFRISLFFLLLLLGCSDKITPEKQDIIYKNEAISQTKKTNFSLGKDKVLITATRLLSNSDKNYEYFVVSIYPKPLKKAFSVYNLNEKISLNKLEYNSEILLNLPFINEWNESFYLKVKKQDEQILRLDFRIDNIFVAFLTFQLD